MTQFQCDRCDQRVPDWVLLCAYCGQASRTISPPIADSLRVASPVLLTRPKRLWPKARPRAATPCLAPRPRELARLVEVGPGSSDGFYCGFERRLGDGGLFVATTTPAPIGELLRLRMRLPGWLAPLPVIGRVRWIRVHDADRVAAVAGMGLTLGALPAGVEADIDRYMADHEPIFYDDTPFEHSITTRCRSA